MLINKINKISKKTQNTQKLNIDGPIKKKKLNRDGRALISYRSNRTPSTDKDTLRY